MSIMITCMGCNTQLDPSNPRAECPCCMTVDSERVLLEAVAKAACAWIRNPGHKQSYTLERAVDALERFREAR